MLHRTPSRLVGLALALGLCTGAAPGAAQDPMVATELPAALLERLLTEESSWLPTDATGKGAQALRASYKAEADAEGFTIVPFRGADAPRSWPWRWSTTRVARGEQELAPDASGELRYTGELAVREHGLWRERWELRANGVEQSWVFDALPAGGGDLVIEGAIASDLVCAPRAAEHAPLLFVDGAGAAVLSYGTALAFDARGAELAVPTAWDGERLRLIVDGGWLADAALPVVVDPLSSPVSLSTGFTTRPLSSVAVAYAMSQSQAALLVALTRPWSATDHDVAAYACAVDLSSTTLVMRDLSVSASDEEVEASFAAGADRWVVGFERAVTTAAGQFTNIRSYVHDRTSTTLNGGLSNELTGAPIQSYSALEIGGTEPSGIDVDVLLVFQVDSTTSRQNTGSSRVVGRILDAAQFSFGPLIELSRTQDSSFDREMPTVRASTGLSESWLVVWTERQGSLQQDDNDLMGNGITRQGTALTPWVLANGFTARHLVYPTLCGASYRWIIVYGESASLANAEPVRVMALAFEWNTAIATPRFSTPARVVAAGMGTGGSLRPTSAVFDRDTTQHAHCTYLRRESLLGLPVSRYAYLGITGGVIEDHVLFASPTESAVAPSLAFDVMNEETVAVFGSATLSGSVQAARFGRSGQALVLGLGGGCGPAILGVGRPYAGSGSYPVNLSGLQPSATAVLMLSLQSISFPLDGIGLTGCGLRADLGSTFLASLTTQASTNGLASVPLVLPDFPVFFGDFVLQYAYIQPGLNSLGIGVSHGVEVRVR
jgi:hypothetical protein